MKLFVSLLFLFSLSNPVFAAGEVPVTVAAHGAPGDYLKIIFAAGMIICTFLSFLIWYRFGKDEIVIPVVNFYPPGGINPAEAELVYKGKVSTRGITALIIYLANKGYLKIKEEGKTYSLEISNDILSGLDDVSKTVMEAINPFNNSFVTKEELKTSYIFNDTCQQVIKELNYKRNLIFYKESINIVLFSIMVIFLLIVISLTAAYFYCFSHPDINGIILGIICSTFCSICTYNLPKRNNIGLKLLGGLLGLKKFIQVAKKHELEMLVEKHPSYFYDVLPFAYILDVSDKWINKFENISVIEPNWAIGNKFLSTSNLSVLSAILNSLNQQIVMS